MAIQNSSTVRVITDETTGDSRSIKNPLLPKHVHVGRLLWYDGFTSSGPWACPAIITWVHEKKQLFRVRSLDDMREQDTEYTADADRDRYQSCRQNMRLSTQEEVTKYLARQNQNLSDIPDFVVQK